MSVAVRSLRRHYVLLIEEAAGPRVLLFPSLDGARVIAASLAYALAMPAPAQTGPGSAVASGGVRLSLWVIGLHGTARLAVTGDTPDGPLVLLATDPLAALATRALVADRDWCPVVVPVEDGLTADLSRSTPTLAPEIPLAPPPPGAALSLTLCPRCEDHQLHEDPVFDDRSHLDGSRICNACGTIEAIRLSRYARLADRGAVH